MLVVGCVHFTKYRSKYQTTWLESLRDSSDIRISFGDFVVGSTRLCLMSQSLTGTSQWSGEERPTSYMGYPILTPAGFPNNCLLMTTVANNVFGTDLVSDFNQAVVVDMTQTDGSDNVRVAMRFTGGTQIADAINGFQLTYASSL